MNGSMYWMLALAIALGFALRFVIVYLRAKQDYIETETEMMIYQHAPELIAQAEQAYASVEKSGEQKMQMCIDSLLPMIPDAVAGLFTGDIIRSIVQTVFDSMMDFANQAVDQAAKNLAQKSVTTRKSKAKASEQAAEKVPIA